MRQDAAVPAADIGLEPVGFAQVGLRHFAPQGFVQ